MANFEEGNPRQLKKVLHGIEVLPHAPRDFEGLREYLKDGRIEGIVWHHPDGRLVKIRAKDFGIDRVTCNEFAPRVFQNIDFPARQPLNDGITGTDPEPNRERD